MTVSARRSARATVGGDVALHLDTSGAGPTLLLVHGFGGSARNWRPQLRALARPAGGERPTGELGTGWQVAAFDVRGHARSEAPPDAASYAPACFVADVGRVLDHLGAARAVVGGLSMGAGIALRFALGHPERTRALVLAAFPPGARSGARQRAWALAFADAIEHDGLEAAGARYAWGPESGLDEAAARLVRLGFLEHAPHAVAHTLRQLIAAQPDPAEMADELRALAMPTLVVVGGGDPVSRRPSEALARALPNAEFVVVEGAGHVVNLAARDRFNAVLAAFLGSLAARGA